jgi:glycosyltransferase involved in cell wall biosynthesis
VEDELNEGIRLFEEQQLNKALSIFKKILSKEPNNKRALYYSSIIYRQLKKWSLAKKVAEKYLNVHGEDSAILEVLGDVLYFEGDYLKAKRIYLKVLKLTSDTSKQKEIQVKLENTTKKIDNTKNMAKVALIVAEGSDSFTDDVLEGLAGYFWIRKFTLSKNQARIYTVITKVLQAKILNEKIYKLFLYLYPSILKKAIKWGDVIWVEWAANEAVVASYLKKPSKKLFIRLHRYEAFEPYPFLIKWENVDKVVFVSNFMKEVLEDRGIKINNEKSKVIYNGVDLDRYDFKQRENGYNIGWVAHISPRKNLHLALEIIRKLVEKDERYVLHIAGDFPDLMYERYIKHLIKAGNLEKNVILYGWVDDMAKWWNDKNYLLSTSMHEGHPYNIMEGMAKGIKPIIHNFDGAEELFDKQFLFSNIDEAVEKITTGEYNSSYYREYIEKKGWTLEKQIEEFKRLINDLVIANHV